MVVNDKGYLVLSALHRGCPLHFKARRYTYSANHTFCESL